jgi:hypothetical protein
LEIQKSNFWEKLEQLKKICPVFQIFEKSEKLTTIKDIIAYITMKIKKLV